MLGIGTLARIPKTIAAFALLLLLFPFGATAQYSATWRTVAVTDLPVWRGWTAMTWAGNLNRIVLWGGSGGVFLNDIHAYDPLARDWQVVEAGDFCPGNTGFDAPNGSDENGLVYDPINNGLWLVNGGSGYRCITFLPPRTAGAGTGSTLIVDPALTADTIDYYKDFWVTDRVNYAVVTAYNPAMRSLSLDRPLALAAGSSYQLFADTGAGTWFYSFASGQYRKLESRHWGYNGPLPTGRRLSPGFASNGVDSALLFGGVDGINGTFWVFDNSTWKLDFASGTYSLLVQMGGGGAPAARGQIENQLVYDTVRGRYILFGGRCFDPGRCTIYAPMNDTWEFNPQTNTWLEVSTATRPPARDQAQMFFDSVRGVVVLHGGSGNAGVMNDVWVYDPATRTWTQAAIVGAPPPALHLSSVAFAPNTGCGYIVHGLMPGSLAAGTWELCLNAGSPANTPPSVSLTSPTNNASFAAPASVSLTATASDTDGTIARVEFYRGGVLIATDTTAPYTHVDSGLAAGSYSYTAVAHDDGGASTTSSAVSVSVTPQAGASTNVAAAANGGVATASSTLFSGFGAGSTINGDRRGIAWGNGGGWHDATVAAYPDWLEVRFNASYTIGQVDLFTLQDNYQSPIEPTPALGFSLYGITQFQLQYWSGTAWVDIPGTSVSGNSLVWRKFTFAPIVTDRVRVLVYGSPDGYSRITEIEAWTP